MTNTGVLDDHVRARVSAALPDAAVDAVLQHTGKTVVLAATVRGQRAVVKVLADPDPFWAEKFAAELATYRTFEATPPPVPVPRLLAADPTAGILAVTWLPGVPVHPDRYPPKLNDTTVGLLVDTAARLRTWQTPDGSFAPVFDYPARYTRYQRLGLLDQADVAALAALGVVAGAPRMTHGDLLPANVLHQPTADGAPVVTGMLDFEFTGLFLPCFDLALLWVLLAHTPGARQRITAAVGSDPGDLAGFWINVAMVCTRELRTHGDLDAGHPLRARLPALSATWARARQGLRESAGGL
ncbi:MAG: phosphotransferase [Dactylosporangium sp.]|nr:aminoglycoside phosphotransferase family protein [Dactylosporangium sp.]NNJ63442.1 phosphotransferase [Dactylosporangium sp.]